MPHEQSDDVAAEVRDAVERTLQAGTARIRQTMLGPHGRVEATGTIDFVQRRATAVLALPPHPDAPDPDTTTEITMVIDGVDTYTEVVYRPGRFILDRLANAGESMSAGDPGMLLDLLRGTFRATPVKDTEPEDVDPEGDTLTAIHVEIDLDRAIERAPDDLRRPLREAFETILRDRRPHQARVHLDGDGHIRHISVALNATATAEQPVEQLEVELFDLGANIVIDLPGATSILDHEELADLGAELAARFGEDELTPPGERDDSADTAR